MKRLRFSETEIIGILKEADSGVSTVREICRKHGISDAIITSGSRNTVVCRRRI